MSSSPRFLDNCLAIGAICILCNLLAACNSVPKPGPVKQPEAVRPDIRICAKIPDPPSLDPLAGFPRPITPREIDATERLKDYDLSVFGWGVEGWDRAALAKSTYCK